MGCDYSRWLTLRQLAQVSIHAPAWGATWPAWRCGSRSRCFNPRTRVGCDPESSACNTGGQGFNPRTRVGCDWRPASARSSTTSFNPRTRVGCDARSPDISPARGPGFNPRTRVGCDASTADTVLGITSFNPRTRVGCDMPQAAARLVALMFQSTHPRGVRPANHAIHGIIRACFNPRTRVGCDERDNERDA